MSRDVSNTGQGVYRIRHLGTDAAYVGIAQRFNKRWADHRCDLRLDRHHSNRLQRLWNLYGAVFFVFEVLEEIEDRENLVHAEQRHMNAERVLLNSNSRAGGGAVTGRTVSIETRNRIGAGNRGRVHSAESRQNMSSAHKGYVTSAETRGKQSAAKVGFVPVNRRNQSHCIWGHPLPTELRADGRRKNCGECLKRRDIERRRARRREGRQCLQ